MKNLIIYICLILLIPVSAICQDRNTAWVHGLNGENSGTWTLYDNVFETERKMQGQRLNYTSNIGVNAAATLARTDWATAASNNGFFTTDPQNVGIGHSMGGIVLRDIELDFPATDFGGFITVGSPNNGTQLVNAVNNGDAGDMIANGVQRLAAGPLTEISVFLGIISVFADEITTNALQNQIIDPLLGGLTGNQSAQDLSVGSGKMVQLDNNPSTVPRLSMWGNEESPVHWRLGSTGLNGPSDDQEFVDIANRAQDIYNLFMVKNTIQAIISGIGCAFNPALCVTAAKHTFKATQWNRGRTWIKNSETMWIELLDCHEGDAVTTGSVTVTTNDYEENCAQFLDNYPAWFNCVRDVCGAVPISECSTQTTITYSYLIGDASDGLICGLSQIGEVTVQADTYECIGLNHLEETNSSFGTNDVMRIEFNKIWNRDPGDFFRTEIR